MKFRATLRAALALLAILLCPAVQALSFRAYLSVEGADSNRCTVQLAVQGGQVSAASGNALQLVQSAVRTVLSETSKVMGRLRLTDLDTRPVLLSYVDADAALFVLRAMGYSAITDTEPLPRDDWYKGDDVPPSPPPQGLALPTPAPQPPTR